MTKRVIVEVGHPNDVHQFKHLFYELSSIGWEVLFLAKQKDIVIELLDTFNLPYKIFGITRASTLMKIVTLPIFILKHYFFSKTFKPDLFISRISPNSGIVASLMRKPHIGFTDTENVGLLDKIAVPFTDIIFTSYSYQKKYKKNHFYYPGYIETWYLHPNRFMPDTEILNILNIQPGERFTILRFVSWRAHHDKGIQGLTDTFKIKLVEKLLAYGKVFISSEKKLPEELERFKFNLSPEKMHDALYYASLFYGESATMTSECAMLGTPAIFIDPRGLGYTNEQQYYYNLVYNFTLSEHDLSNSLLKVDEILSDKDFKFGLIKNHKKLLDDVIDPICFIKWFLVNYPSSTETLNMDPYYWRNFK